ncbi:MULTISPECIES: hypothetical protein [Corynebacterium]|uniref:hypothetical protein n=1 Tax=Corynebacterium TaxID=1716 RepID=UPI00124DF947|nr:MULTISPECIES: hypothetical protein [Corynebacterium]MBV7282247.1 hypothetical protein [Corynebacterium sp. TAE3-ERU30]MBV7302412.1 hypothetical protein [Corynebacterium sp. TAE3-ERU2]
MLAVTDRPDEQHHVIWHVDDDFDTATGVTAGAWILGGDYPVGREREKDLLQVDAVLDSREAISALVERMRTAAEELKASTKNLRLPAITDPDWESYEDAFSGEPIARECWVRVRAVVDLIEVWHGMERARLRRKALKDADPNYRPLPAG